ncbi:MAG: hypothetical protein KatS3mg044_1033 [Rhodothermaceae bacterium]|nr:MAG: hypothetical protein KatS3mg044_1033 [Rhodothermaceae bacterium]
MARAISGGMYVGAGQHEHLIVTLRSSLVAAGQQGPNAPD